MSDRHSGDGWRTLPAIDRIRRSRMLKLIGGVAVVITGIVVIGVVLFFSSSTAIAGDTEREPEKVSGQVQEFDNSIQSIDAATAEQADTSRQIATMVERATEQSEETSQETGSVAAVSEELTATVTELSAGARNLALRLRRFTAGRYHSYKPGR